MALQVKLLADTPEMLGERFPRFDTMAQRLADLLPQLPSSSPILLSGDWGSGKTTILRAVEAKVSCPSVFFEAWRYEAELPLLPALIRATYLSTPASYRTAENETKQALRRNLWHATAALCAGAGDGVVGLFLGTVGQSAVAKLVELWKSKGKSKPSDYLPTEDSTEQLWESLKKLIETAWPTSTAGGSQSPLVVLIDDLDRCSPAKAVALLESIRMLVSIGRDELPCRFLVALDRGIVSQAVANKFADVSQFDGNRYLEKIFPVSFDVPRSDAHGLEILLKQLDQNIRIGVSSSQVDDLSQCWREVLNQALDEPIFANPRLAKRCINRFLLLKQFELGDLDHVMLTTKLSEASIREDILLVRWLAATERWPNLRRLLASRTEDNWRETGKALREGTELDSEIGALLLEQDAEVWMDRWFFSQDHYARDYRTIEGRLRRHGL